MAREGLGRFLLATLALTILAAGVEAQRGRGRGRGARVAGAPGAKKTPGPPLPPLTLPGFELPGDAKKPGPAQKSEAAPKPAPAKPPDPMAAADLVTATADHLALQAENDTRRLREHFGVCDLDQNAWLSLREAEVTLSLTRDEYRRTDADQDGRVDLAEFEAQQELLLTRLGVPSALPTPAVGPKVLAEAPAEPMLEPESGSQPGGVGPEGAARAKRAGKPASEFAALLVRPNDLLRRYDLDRSKGIGVVEIEKLFNEIGLALSAEMVVSQMDPNDSGELGARELTPLAWLTSKHLPESLRSSFDPPPAASEAGGAEGSDSPAPARALATHFERLDSDHDGSIGESDLRALQGNTRLEVRLRAVLSALDSDGDGRLSESEFRTSMRVAPR